MKIAYENTVGDILTAIEVIDARGTAAKRKIFWFLGSIMVLYWFIPPLFSDPTLPTNWVMAAIALGLTVYVWKGPDFYNRRFAKHYVASSPTGAATFTDEGIFIEDGYGSTTLRFADGVNVYEYKGLFAISAGRQKIAVVPLHGLVEDERKEYRDFLRERLDTRFEKVDSLSNSGGNGSGPFSKWFK